MFGASRPQWTVQVASALATVALIGATAVASAQSPAPATLEVTGAWARTSPMMELALSRTHT